MSEEIKVTVDDHDVQLELNRLGRLPYGAKGDLDLALKEVKEEIRSHIHVRSGKLKTRLNDKSIRTSHIWEGKVTVGTGLGYAIYEKDRMGVKESEGGTPHNFILASKAEADATIAAAILEALRKS